MCVSKTKWHCPYRIEFRVGEAIRKEVQPDGDEKHEDEGEAQSCRGLLDYPQDDEHENLDPSEQVHLPGSHLLREGCCVLKTVAKLHCISLPYRIVTTTILETQTLLHEAKVYWIFLCFL